MRVKTTGDYIEELITSLDDDSVELGERLEELYQAWSRRSSLNAFLTFLREAHSGRHLLGSPQFYGRFRNNALEEYVHRLIKKQLHHIIGDRIHWGRHVQLHRGSQYTHSVEVDVCIGKEISRSGVEPELIADCRVELDSAQLLNSVGLASLVKQSHPECVYFLVCVLKNVEDGFLGITAGAVDGVYQLSNGPAEVKRLLNGISEKLASPSPPARV